MKIVFLSKWVSKAGTTTHLISLGKELVSLGHKVYAVSGGPLDNDERTLKLEKELEAIGVEVVSVKFPKEEANENKLKQLANYMIVTPSVLKKIRHINPDIIHVHWPVTSYLAKIYKCLYKVPFITTLHIQGITITPLHTKADGCIAISSEIKKEALERFGYEENEIHLIYNGVEKKEKLEKCKRNTTPVVTFVGSLSRRKGIDILIRAIAGVVKQGYKLKVLLVGDGEKEWVNNMITEYELEKYIEILPFQDPQPIYEKSDIFVLPSRGEGFPLVIVEAMMNGLVPIRSNTAGAYNQIKHGDNGYIFKNEDYKELEQYIINLLEDEKLRIKMGEKSYIKASSEFTGQIMAKKTLEAYYKVIGRYRGENEKNINFSK